MISRDEIRCPGGPAGGQFRGRLTDELEYWRAAGIRRPYRVHPCGDWLELPQARPNRDRPGALVALVSDRSVQQPRHQHHRPAAGVPRVRRGRGGLALPEGEPDRRGPRPVGAVLDPALASDSADWYQSGVSRTLEFKESMQRHFDKEALHAAAKAS